MRRLEIYEWHPSIAWMRFLSLRVAFCAIVMLLLGLVGCASPCMERTPVYPMFWNAEGDEGPGLYVYTSYALILDADKVELRVEIWNHTGRDLFLARIGEHPLTGLKYDIRGEKGLRAHGSRRLVFGCSAPFDLIVSTPFSSEQGMYDRPMSVEVNRCIPSFSGSSSWMDVDLDFPLHYWAAGATSPVWIDVRKTIRLARPEAEVHRGDSDPTRGSS